MIGYAFCGSFCTAMESMRRLKSLVDMGIDAVPIMSERIYSTKTRFFRSFTMRSISPNRHWNPAATSL